MEVNISRGTVRDLPAARALVAAAGLPVDGVYALAHEPNLLVVARAGDDLVGCAGLEPYGDTVLLRSLVVAPAQRGAGLGQRLVTAALDAAGDREVWLLTETAAGFFAGLGFVPVDRSDVTGPVTRSLEWTAVCATSATVMTWPRPAGSAARAAAGASA